MIRFNHVTFTYSGAKAPTLRDVTAVIGPGELGLVVGLTGSGKSTLLRLVNGLVPHFSGGLLAGSVQVGGLDTRHHGPRNLAGLVGYVGQDPAAGFVADVVEDELAYSMEQHAIARSVMRARVEEVIDLLGLEPLRHRPVNTLSAGQAQRVAMAAALTLHPKVLVLDEPTSALDPATAEEVMAAISRLVHDLDMTVLMAEHRLERVVQFADLSLHVSQNGVVTSGNMRAIMATSDVAPPVVQLARRLAWPTIPLTVREARRLVTAGPVSPCHAPDNQEMPHSIPGRVSDNTHPGDPPRCTCHVSAGSSFAPATSTRVAEPITQQAPGDKKSLSPTDQRQQDAGLGPSIALHAEGLTVTYPGGVNGIDHVNLTLHAGKVTAVMGRNGSGKTSLLWALQGQGPPGALRASRTARFKLPAVALVPAQPTDLFWANTVAAEVGSGPAQLLLDDLAPGIDPASHPRDLSEGQRLELALAIQLAANAPVLALDEPTRGLDYQAKERLATMLRRLATEGKAVLVASHDVEFLALVAKRVVWLADGQIIADGPATELLMAVPAHAPQMAKVFAPAAVLTVNQAIGLAGGLDANPVRDVVLDRATEEVLP